MSRSLLALCLTVLPSTFIFAESDPPQATPDCTGGTIPANFIVVRVAGKDAAGAKEALRVMKGVVLAESVPDTKLVRILANDMAITSERVIQFLHLGGYDVSEASKEESDAALAAIQNEPDRIIIYRSPGRDPGTQPVEKQPSGAEVVFPDTTAGRVAKGYIEAFNSGDPEKMREFERNNRSDSALKSRAMDDRIHQYQELYAGWGHFQVRGVEYEGDRDITVEVLGTNSEMGLRAIFELEESTDKLNQIRLTPSMMDVELPDATPDPNVQVTSIADSIEPLKKRFNAHKGKPRFVAVLSPT